NLSFIPLHGERDEEHQFGVTIPFHGWTLDASNFLTRVENFFDHNNFNNSDLFFPVTIQGARINGWELTLRSPRIRHGAQVYLTYSNQLALAFGNINGGLTDFYFRRNSLFESARTLRPGSLPFSFVAAAAESLAAWGAPPSSCATAPS